MGTNPWYPLQALGLGLLILLTTGVPALTLAQPDQLVWESHVSRSSNVTFLFLIGSITTLAGLRRLYASLYKKKSDLDPTDLADMPASGRNLGDMIHEYIKIFAGKYYSLMELRTTEARLTPNAEYRMDATIRESMTQTLGRILDRFEELETIHEGHIDTIEDVTTKLRDLMALPDEETLENMLKHTEELLKFAKGIRREFNQWFPDETNTTLDNVIKKIEEHFTAATQLQSDYDEAQQEIADKDRKLADQMNELGRWETLALLFPGAPKTWKTVSGRIRTLMDQTSVAPLIALFTTPPTDQTIPGIAQNIRNNLNDLEIAVQSLCPSEKLSDYQSLEDFIYKTQDFSKRATKYWKHMSGIQQHSSALDESDSKALDSVIDRKYAKPHLNTGYTGEQLREIIEEMQADLNTLGKRPAPSTGNCGHPEELARTVHFNPQTVSWVDSLDEVTRLYNLSQQPQQGAPPAQGGQEESLFRASEAPEFKERKSYWSYRSSLNRFKSGILVKDVHRGLALNRILSRFTGNDVSDASNRWDLTPMIHAYPTWETIYAAFLAELDRRFLSPDFAKQQEIKFRSLRSRDKEPQEFMLDFETQVRTTQEALQLAGQRELENGEIMRQLLAVLPGDVRTKIYDKHDYPEGEDFFTLSPSIIRWWKNLPKNTTSNPKNTKKSGGNSNSGTPTAFSPGSPRKHPEWGTCNKPCWDTERIVPNGNRGKYQNIQRGKDLLCPHCRRGKSDHGGNPEGCQQHGQHQYHGNGSHSANPSGNDEGDH